MNGQYLYIYFNERKSLYSLLCTLLDFLSLSLSLCLPQRLLLSLLGIELKCSSWTRLPDRQIFMTRSSGRVTSQPELIITYQMLNLFQIFLATIQTIKSLSNSSSLNGPLTPSISTFYFIYIYIFFSSASPYKPPQLGLFGPSRVEGPDPYRMYIE